MKETVKFKMEDKKLDPFKLPSNIPKNIAPKEKPDKDEAIRNMCTRFET